MIAVIQTGSKQYRVTENDVISVEKLGKVKGDKVTFEDILFVSDGLKTMIGTPGVEGAAVSATVLREGRGPRITIYKMKAKKNYRNKNTHKQTYTTVKIDGITLG